MKTSRFFLKVAVGLFLKIVVGLLIVVFIIIGVAVLTGDLGRPILWEFSPGYRGWVVVEYQRPDCPPLVKDGLYLIISVSASGRACTSSPIPLGWRYGRYEYVSEERRRKIIPSSGWDSNREITLLSVDFEKKLQFLFVGNRQELNRSWGSRPDK
jgi:hypothetical protein